jgi:phage terminase small subunit
MRSTAVFALFALSLLPATAFAQASQQAAAQPSPTSSVGSPPSSSAGLTKEQYIQRAEQRAARRAAAQFDRMDADHDGVLDPAERRAWRSQHPRGAGSRSAQSPTQ